MTTVADVDMSTWNRQSASPIFDGDHVGTVRSGVRQNLIHEDTFDGGTLDLTRYTGSGNTPVVKAIVGGALDGQNVMEVFIDKDSVSGSQFRTEVTCKGFSDADKFDEGISARYGETYWYGASIYIPSDFVEDNLDGGYGVAETLMQWHGRPSRDSEPKENYRNPMVTIMIDNDSYLLVIKSDSKAITSYEPDSPVYERIFSKNLGFVAPTVGKWTNWTWRIKWGYDSTGEIDLYQDGVLVHTETGLANCYNDFIGAVSRGPYLKMGCYKSHWKDGRPDTATQTRLYYFDNFRVGNSNATLADVWEDHS